MKNKKIFTFLAVFTFLNAALVPLMALYGISICAVLRVPGFRFGCAYAGTFIASVTVLNFALIGVFLKIGIRLPQFLRRHPTILYFASYIFSSVAGLLILERLFEMNHITGGSRAPEILALASLLLGITQAYGLNWALPEASPEETHTGTFFRAWGNHTFRTMLPGAVAVIVVLHFLLIQFTLIENVDIIPMTPLELIQQSAQVIAFVVAWMLMTYLFHFLSERDYAERVGTHLRELGEGNIQHQSPIRGAWGLWSELIFQLNNFSRTLGERTNLLKSFSRFVSGEVANRALDGEITSVSGKAQELTIIMTDIRDFTRLSETLEASEVVNILNQYFTEMLDVLAGHQIIVDKFIGDGILAYVDPDTGLSPEEQNRTAVAASLAMLHRLQEFQKKSVSPVLRMGIGIHRGHTIKGNIGSITKLQHTIIGDSVNRAARMESLCKELKTELVITQGIWESLGNEVKARFQLAKGIQVKGLSSTLDVWKKV